MRQPLISILLTLLGFQLSGQISQYVIDSEKDIVALNDYLYVLELENDEITIDEVLSKSIESQFVPYNQFIQSYLPAVSKDRVLLNPDLVYWWRITISNAMDQPIKDWVLHTGRSNFTEVYYVNSEKELVDVKYTGWLMPIPKKDFEKGNRQAERVAFYLPKDSTITLYAKVWNVNNKEPYFLIKLAKEDFYKNWEYVQRTRIDWAFIGAMLTFILFNILFFGTTRDKVFFWHSVYLAAIYLYLLEFFNVLPDMIWWRDHRIAVQVFIYVTLCLMDVAYLQFIRSFMDMKTLRPVWDKRINWFVILRILYSIGVIMFFLLTKNMKTADDLTAFFMVAEYMIMIGLLIWLFRWRNVQSRFLIAGTAVFVVAIVVNAISVVRGTGLIFSYTQFGVLGEVILFTIGLGYRMKRLIKKEHETQRLKDLDDFKSKFYTNITHEFRTPLTVIMGLSQSSLPDNKTKDFENNQKGNLQIIYRNAQLLLRLINRLLDLSKLQSGKMPLNLKKGNIAGYLRYLVESFHSLAASKDIQLRFISGLDNFIMDFDAEKIQDVLTNLIANAIKFSPEGSEIIVELKNKNEEWNAEESINIVIKDNGIGISEEALPHIFDRFSTSKDTGNPAGGSGIGLALSKELVELMGGKISAVSEYGNGTEFSILLPVTKNAQNLELSEYDFPLIKDEFSDSFETKQGHILSNEEKPLCLVIDDNIDVVRFLQKLLEEHYRIATAFDGKRGIDKALELLPDVIISDVMMPEKDGLEVCDYLKNDVRTSHIPIVLLTAKSSIEDRLEGLRRGADVYLQKPFNHEELFLSLKTSVELRKELREKFSSPLGLEKSEIYENIGLAIENEFIVKAKNVVKENMSNDEFDINRFCRLMAMSRAQLHRKLTALTGKSASHFIRTLRLIKAKELLVRSDLTVSEIAYEVGFRDPNYFSRSFAEEFGIPPSETRK